MYPPDGGLFDALTFAVGITIVIIKFGFGLFITRSRNPVNAATLDLFHGCLIFPFACLLLLPILSWLSPIFPSQHLVDVLSALTGSNHGSLALAGGAGMFFVLGEVLKFD